MKYFSLLILLLLISSCQNEPGELTADAIVNKAIEKAGGEKYENMSTSFVFRKTKYTSEREGGLYEFTREFEDSLGQVRDVLSNEGFIRYRNGEREQLPDSLSTAYAESVNSVHYFVQLPYGLNGPAVQKELVSEDTVAGVPYYEIRVTFKKEGGGADYEDIYMYWIHKDNFTVDYMAYRFFVNDGGIRFRVAVNPRTINGIRIVDYENYKTDDLSTPLDKLDQLYERGELEKVSQIENEEVKVKLLSPN